MLLSVKYIFLALKWVLKKKIEQLLMIQNQKKSKFILNFLAIKLIQTALSFILINPISFYLTVTTPFCPFYLIVTAQVFP